MNKKQFLQVFLFSREERQLVLFALWLTLIVAFTANCIMAWAVWVSYHTEPKIFLANLGVFPVWLILVLLIGYFKKRSP